MNSSTVPTVKAALVAALLARAGLTGVQVRYSDPGNELERQSIFLGNVRGKHEIPVMTAARKRRDESYELDVIVYVQSPGGTQSDAEAAAFTLLAEVEGTLADDPRIGTAVLDWAKAGTFDMRSGRTDKGAECGIRLQVECKARLT